jgi:MoaA/NifB/PqqE/SkfB family radical SAM enzyme
MSVSAATRSTPLSELHLLVTYECNYECDHCFVWGGPSQNGTMTEETIENILRQAGELGTVEWIYFEGGEAFLHYRLLCSGIRKARELGFRIGLVTNAFWATNDAEAMEWLQPFAGVVEDLSISNDAYHGSKDVLRQTHIAHQAAEQLGIPVNFISVAGPEAADVHGTTGQLPAGESNVLYRGRAAEKLALSVQPKTWKQFTDCPWEDLRHPERVHVDAFGNLHICQGISIGNLLEHPLTEIIRDYDPDTHPIVGPLLAGGPVELVNRYELPYGQGHADACHLCYISRCKLRNRFPEVLTPDQMYGKV